MSFLFFLTLPGIPGRTKQKGAWRNWYFIYESPETGKRSYKPLGTYPELGLAAAREKARVLSAAVLQKIDPLAEESRERDTKVRAAEELRRAAEAEERRVTVADLCAEYLERHAKPKKRSWKKDEEILNRDVIPTWGQRKAEDVTKRDVINLLEGIVDRGAPVMANNCFALIRKMFNFAVERDILPASPCTRVKPPAPKVTRDRNLSESEIKTFWNNLDRCAMTDEIRRALKLILVTAQRPGEVIGMHTRELDGCWWTIPAERVKNGRTHHVYLTDTALELIGDTEGKGYIFPAPSHDKEQAMAPQAMIVALSRNRAWLVTDSEGKPLLGEDGMPVTENRLGVDHFTPHDLRRTANTLMASCRVIKEYRERVLNHTLEKLDGTYNLYDYDDEKRSALETLSRKLQSILSGTEGKVIPLLRQTKKIRGQ